MSNKGPWIIVGAIIAAALILVGGYWFMTSDERACDRFRAAVQMQAVQTADVLGTANEDRRVFIQSAAEIFAKDGVVRVDGERIAKPEGCTI